LLQTGRGKRGQGEGYEVICRRREKREGGRGGSDVGDQLGLALEVSVPSSRIMIWDAAEREGVERRRRGSISWAAVEKRNSTWRC